MKKLLVSLLSSIVIFFLASCSSSSESLNIKSTFIGWTNAEGQSFDGKNANVSNNLGYSGSPSLKIDTSGNPCVAWEDKTDGNSEIFYTKWDGSHWINIKGDQYDGVNANVSKNKSLSKTPSLAFDSLGNPCIAWEDGSTSETEYPDKAEIFYVKWNGYHWINAEGDPYDGKNANVSKNYRYSCLPSLVISSTDNPCIAWEEKYSEKYLEDSGYSQIFYTKWNGSRWIKVDGKQYDGENANVSGINSLSLSFSFAIDSSDNPCIVWSDESEFNYEINYVKWNGLRWTNVEGKQYNVGNANVSNNKGDSYSPTLALDILGNPSIAWSDYSFKNYFHTIFYVKWDGYHWINIENKEYDGENAYINNCIDKPWKPYLAIKLDSLGSPCIAWYSDSNELLFVRWNGSKWTNTEGQAYDGKNANVSQSSRLSLIPSLALALNSSDNPCMAWQEESNGNEIFFVKWKK